jgi:hypothetical protein
MKTWFFIFAFLLLFPMRADVPDRVWRYQLLKGSLLMDECLICGRPTFNIPMRGSFMLRLIEVNPVATRYAIEDARFTAGPDYIFTGSGTYQITGDFALKQTMTLQGDLQNAGVTKQVGFTNDSPAITRRWPMLFATLKQTNGTFGSAITLTIAAAPLQEIWFSTSTNFTRAIKINNSVSDGDLLSSAGRIVAPNSYFQQHFPGPTFQNIGLDAVDILPGADIVFSAYTKGVLNDGDFASADTGEIVHWEDLMKLAAPSLTSDPGLDALQIDPFGKYFFSIKEDAGADAVGNGDILVVDPNAQSGSVFRKNSDLLAQFHPAEIKDYGLDALFIWPNGEIWFSTANGFSDAQLGDITGGDLLSDAGYIVYRNADLTAALQPVGNPPTDFGLDALVIVSDALTSPEETTVHATLDPANDSVILSWKSNGRAFQVERAHEVLGPWEAITPIIPALTAKDSDSVSFQQRAFYRVRQW